MKTSLFTTKAPRAPRKRSRHLPRILCALVSWWLITIPALAQPVQVVGNPPVPIHNDQYSVEQVARMAIAEMVAHDGNSAATIIARLDELATNQLAAQTAQEAKLKELSIVMLSGLQKFQAATNADQKTQAISETIVAATPDQYKTIMEWMLGLFFTSILPHLTKAFTAWKSSRSITSAVFVCSAKATAPVAAPPAVVSTPPQPPTVPQLTPQ